MGDTADLWESFGWVPRPSDIIQVDYTGLNAILTALGNMVQQQGKSLAAVNQTLEDLQSAGADSSRRSSDTSSRLEELERRLLDQQDTLHAKLADATAAAAAAGAASAANGSAGSAPSADDLAQLRSLLENSDKRLHVLERRLGQEEANTRLVAQHVIGRHDADVARLVVSVREKSEALAHAVDEWNSAYDEERFSEHGDTPGKLERMLVLYGRLEREVMPLARELEVQRSTLDHAAGQLEGQSSLVTDLNLPNQEGLPNITDRLAEVKTRLNNSSLPLLTVEAARERVLTGLGQYRPKPVVVQSDSAGVVQPSGVSEDLVRDMVDGVARRMDDIRRDIERKLAHERDMYKDMLDSKIQQSLANLTPVETRDEPSPVPLQEALSGSNIVNKDDFDVMVKHLNGLESKTKELRERLDVAQSAAERMEQEITPIPGQVSSLQEEQQQVAAALGALERKLLRMQDAISAAAGTPVAVSPESPRLPQEAAEQIEQIQGRLQTQSQQIADMFKRLQEQQASISAGREEDPAISEEMRKALDDQAHQLSDLLQRQADAEARLATQIKRKADLADVQNVASVISRKADEAWVGVKLEDKLDRSNLDKLLDEYMQSLDSKLTNLAASVRDESKQEAAETRRRFKAQLRDAIKAAMEEQGANGNDDAKTRFGRVKVYCAGCDRPVSDMVGTPVPTAVHNRMPQHAKSDEYVFRGGGFRVPTRQSRMRDGSELHPVVSPPAQMTRPRSGKNRAVPSPGPTKSPHGARTPLPRPSIHLEDEVRPQTAPAGQAEEEVVDDSQAGSQTATLANEYRRHYAMSSSMRV